MQKDRWLILFTDLFKRPADGKRPSLVPTACTGSTQSFISLVHFSTEFSAFEFRACPYSLAVFRNRRPRLSRVQQLASKPIRLVVAEMSPSEGGGGKLRVPIKPRRWTRWLLRMPDGAAKTFEFDAIGRLVWDLCDGKTSVGQIGRRLARTYKLSDREAQVATEKFLIMLANKGLIGAAVKKGGKTEN